MSLMLNEELPEPTFFDEPSRRQIRGGIGRGR
jgi:hypothetical protein